jgi:hypothetical protein
VLAIRQDKDKDKTTKNVVFLQQCGSNKLRVRALLIGLIDKPKEVIISAGQNGPEMSFHQVFAEFLPTRNEFYYF